MKRAHLQKILLISLFSAVISITAMISVPFPIPFTLQTFSIFLALMTLNGKCGFACVALYIALGIIGLPVFAGFGAGFGYFFGASGGFVIGFFAAAALYLVIEKCFGIGKYRKLIYSFICLSITYVIGTLWFSYVYSSDYAFIASLTVCVLPFIIPDIIKIMLAYYVSERLRKIGF